MRDPHAEPVGSRLAAVAPDLNTSILSCSIDINVHPSASGSTATVWRRRCVSCRRLGVWDALHTERCFRTSGAHTPPRYHDDDLLEASGPVGWSSWLYSPAAALRSRHAKQVACEQRGFAAGSGVDLHVTFFRPAGRKVAALS